MKSAARATRIEDETEKEARVQNKIKVCPFGRKQWWSRGHNGVWYDTLRPWMRVEGPIAGGNTVTPAPIHPPNVRSKTTDFPEQLPSAGHDQLTPDLYPTLENGKKRGIEEARCLGPKLCDLTF